MHRRLLNLLTAMSLLLCVAVAALWARGRGEGEQFIFTTGTRFWRVVSFRSTLAVATVGDWPGPERPRRTPLDLKDPYEHTPVLLRFVPPRWTTWSRLGIRGEHGLVTTWIDADGVPATLAAYIAVTRHGGPGRRSAPVRYAAVYVPYWMALTLFGALPLSRATLRVRRAVRRRWLAARQRCPSCGYDLRATPDKCPECGAAASVTPSA